ncbi:GTP cyclohydrolase I FolE [Parafrigoribacterium soli]|uniref:GTP cyclohydrolase I FolE n=1 Tax=Parafrigoribacterium soli TaxID=3144663 RepID=UPI0032EA9EDB
MSRKESAPANDGGTRHAPWQGIDRGRIEAAVTEILAAIGEDPTRPGLVNTPERIAQAYSEFFEGLAVDPLSHLTGSAEFPEGSDELGELVLLRDIDFRSVCEHHLLPFTGVAHIAYVPRTRIVGLGKLPRVVETLAARPQLQERLTEEIADALQEGLDPLGLLVVLDAAHACVWSRGVRQLNSSTVTMATRGTLSEATERSEVMALIGSARSEVQS